MGIASRLLGSRRRALDRLASLIERPEHLIVIHYACESFYDRESNTSPRVTSIAVRNFDSGQTYSFSIHLAAETLGLSGGDIEDRYSELEKEALASFFEYVHSHVGYIWMHWAMRDINFGFQALAHRYRVLGGIPIDIPESQLFDLSRALVSIYGSNYVQHKRLPNLVTLNGMTHAEFLRGDEEAHAFETRDYYRLHLSTLRKVDILANIALRADQGTLRTESQFLSSSRLFLAASGEWLREHWLPNILIFLVTLVSLVIAIRGCD